MGLRRLCVRFVRLFFLCLLVFELPAVASFKLVYVKGEVWLRKTPWC